MVTIWNPERTAIAEADMLARVEAMTFCGRTPFAEESIALLSSISKAILESAEGRRHPQYVALGYWLRKSALTRMAARLQDRPAVKSSILISRGIAQHLPPTNVDTIFVYSWAVSVLAGNCNIVRLPSDLASHTEWLVKIVASVIGDKGEQDRHCFCSYPHTGKFNEALSAGCDLRLIWGGDEKTKAVSKTPIRPDGLSVGFPDRKSYALINTDAYRQATESERDILAAGLFNDIYWFGQMGCGSPRVLFWIGEPQNLAEDLYRRLVSQVESRNHHIEVGVAITKFAHLNSAIVSGYAQKGKRMGNALTVYETDDPLRAVDVPFGGGLLAQMALNRVGDIRYFVDRRTQTISYFGFDRKSLTELATTISSRGGYRIVPIGQALQFDVVWDGIELLSHMTRRLVIV
jgi:hypothetical protein